MSLFDRLRDLATLTVEYNNEGKEYTNRQRGQFLLGWPWDHCWLDTCNDRHLPAELRGCAAATFAGGRVKRWNARSESPLAGGWSQSFAGLNAPKPPLLALDGVSQKQVDFSHLSHMLNYSLISLIINTVAVRDNLKWTLSWRYNQLHYITVDLQC